MKSLPRFDIKTNVVILGAGASIASTFLTPEKNNMPLPRMPNLVEKLDLQWLIDEYPVEYGGENFEEFYDSLAFKGGSEELVELLEMAIYDYFADLELPNEATIYDYLVLSLREKDVIATFNWDPFLAQAYIRNKNVISHDRMPKITYLHGNVAIDVCYDCKMMGWSSNSCDRCNKKFEPSKLLYPVSKKDYTSDEFINSEWVKLKSYIREAYYLTVFGHSALKMDAEARQVLLEKWETNPIRELADIDILDVLATTEPKSLKENWPEFPVRDHYFHTDTIFNTASFRSPRRSCESFTMATLQNNPCGTEG